MKLYSLRSVALLIALGVSGSPITAAARSMLDIPGVPVQAFRSYLPNEAFQKLVNAPVRAYILVRGQVANNKVSGARVVHSEANGVYDKAAVQIAQSMEIYSEIAGTNVPSSILIHVLIYPLPDKSEDALAIAQNDSVGATNLVYSRSLMMRHLGLAKTTPSASKPHKK